MGSGGEKSLEGAMDSVSSDTARARPQTPLVAPYPEIELTTMKSRGETPRGTSRQLVIAALALLSWLLIAFVIQRFI